jgi:phospholipase/carboxylesterase
MSGPHQGQSLLTTGEALGSARAAMIMVHGRGATARGILGMAGEFDTEEVAYLAPQAQRSEWYPQSFLAPVEQNEPGRSSGLQAIDDALTEVTESGISAERTLIMGFSQGGCLATEYVARNPRRYGGLAALSGGLIGETIDPDDYEGDLEGMPAFFGCSDVDPHIPAERVHESARVFEKLGAGVEKRLYEGMGHTVNEDELQYVSGLIQNMVD